MASAWMGIARTTQLVGGLELRLTEPDLQPRQEGVPT